MTLVPCEKCREEFREGTVCGYCGKLKSEFRTCEFSSNGKCGLIVEHHINECDNPLGPNKETCKKYSQHFWEIINTDFPLDIDVYSKKEWNEHKKRVMQRKILL